MRFPHCRSQDMTSTGEQTFSGTSVTERTLSETDEDYSDSEEDDDEEVSEWNSTGGYVLFNK